MVPSLQKSSDMSVILAPLGTEDCYLLASVLTESLEEAHIAELGIDIQF